MLINDAYSNFGSGPIIGAIVGNGGNWVFGFWRWQPEGPFTDLMFFSFGQWLLSFVISAKPDTDF
jgi:hypothetical protein